MIDRDMVDELIDVLGDSIHRLIEGFELDSDQKLDEMRLALASGNTAALRQLLHSLRGSSGSLGMMQLAERCGELETSLPGQVPNLELLANLASESSDAFRHYLYVRAPM